MKPKIYILGETEEILICTDAEETRRITAAMMTQADRYVDILTRDFEPAVYDNEECGEAIMNLARRGGRYARIRILIGDPQTVARRGHNLVKLGMRIGSYVQFRCPAPEHEGFSESFLIADRIGLIHRPYADSVKAHANFCDPAEARRLSSRFETLWENGYEHPNFRILTL